MTIEHHVRTWCFFLLFYSFYAYSSQLDFLCQLVYVPIHERAMFLQSHQKELIHYINKRTLNLIEKTGSTELVHFVNGGIDGQDIQIFSGVPKWAKLLRVEDDIIFRHYTLNAKEEILKSKSLTAGARPYILPDSHLKQQFNDLTGIFFTKNDFDPHRLWMNYSDKTPYVDFKLPKGLLVLDLGDGVYLIPGHPTRAAWIHDLYSNFQNTGVIPTGMEQVIKDIQRMGGIETPITFPIEIVFP
jgi:hypothetical protein